MWLMGNEQEAWFWKSHFTPKAGYNERTLDQKCSLPVTATSDKDQC